MPQEQFTRVIIWVCSPYWTWCN